jgi:Xaa-Pro dipeptidase
LKGRYRRVFQALPDDVDVVALFNGLRTDTNFFYVTGYTGGLFEMCSCFLYRDGSVKVITSTLEEQAARQKDYEVHVLRNLGEGEIRKVVASVLKGARKVGLNFSGIAHSDFLRISKIIGPGRVVDASSALESARLVKDRDELTAIKRAADVASRVISRVPEMLRTGMSEADLKAELEYSMIKGGADSPSFSTIVAFGENSAVPHHSSGSRRLRRGDTVLVDMGAKFRLYCSDITRTFFYKECSSGQKAAYEVVKKAQERGLRAIHEGAVGSLPHKEASSVIDSSPFKGRFIHSLGHFLGLDVHDGSVRALSEQSQTELLSGMVITVEPGVYLPGRGGVRIEDDVVVTEKGCRVLTDAPKDFTVAH